jgi:hypothetical protein
MEAVQILYLSLSLMAVTGERSVLGMRNLLWISKVKFLLDSDSIVLTITVIRWCVFMTGLDCPPVLGYLYRPV